MMYQWHLRFDGGSIDVHDATLLSITVDWPGGCARIELSLVGGSVARILAVGVRGTTAPRAEPWGPSESVLAAAMAFDAEAGAIRLSMRMQSGDEIVIDAHRFDLEIDEAP